ncbi:MAG: nickel-type superoxide dismutase maturation protease [Candidatus Limnocylindrales bacterium]
MRRLVGICGAALLFALGAIAVSERLGRSWEARVGVEGHSMEPTLLEGDWLLVDPDAYGRRMPRVGELVVARDPRDPRRVIVKRVAAIDADDRMTLAGDHPAHANDAGHIGAVDQAQLLGRPWFRYWPPSRFAPVA